MVIPFMWRYSSILFYRRRIMPKHAKIVEVGIKEKAKMFITIDFDFIINERGSDFYLFKNDIYNLNEGLKLNHPGDNNVMQAIIMQTLYVDVGVVSLHLCCYQVSIQVSQARPVSDYVDMLKSILDSVDVQLSPWGPQNLI